MRRAAIAVLATAVALAGCTPRPAPRPPAPRGALPAAEQLDAAVAARRAALQSLRAWARLSYESPEESRKVKQLLIAERPDRLRMELFSPFGAVFVLAAADGRLAAYDRGTSTVYRGAATAANLQRYTQVGLPVDDAVALLLGAPPTGDGDDRVVSADGDDIKLWWETAGGARAAWFSPALEPLRYEEHAEDGRVLLRATYGDYQPIDGVRVALQVGFELPQTPLRVGIALSDIEVNPPLPPTVFAFETPAGSRLVDLDRGGP